jgi:hypothetical protein
MRFKKAGAGMYSDDDAGDVLEDVARIHPVVDRLRQLVTSATILDLKATAGGYWASAPGGPDDDLAVEEDEGTVGSPGP